MAFGKDLGSGIEMPSEACYIGIFLSLSTYIPCSKRRVEDLDYGCVVHCIFYLHTHICRYTLNQLCKSTSLYYTLKSLNIPHKPCLSTSIHNLQDSYTLSLEEYCLHAIHASRHTYHTPWQPIRAKRLCEPRDPECSARTMARTCVGLEESLYMLLLFLWLVNGFEGVFKKESRSEC